MGPSGFGPLHTYARTFALALFHGAKISQSTIRGIEFMVFRLVDPTIRFNLINKLVSFLL